MCWRTMWSARRSLCGWILAMRPLGKVIWWPVFQDESSARAYAERCCVRPPGHHATTEGIDLAAGGSGFCVINHAAVGAAHACCVHAITRVAVVDFDGGGRAPLELADVDADEVEVGMRVEPTFRRLFTADEIHNYFWKVRPLRGGA